MAMTHSLTSLYFPGRSARDCWFLSCCVARYQLLILSGAQASVCAGAQLILIYELGKRALYSQSPPQPWCRAQSAYVTRLSYAYTILSL
ncbi:unknown [Plutella xylostella multiple nucleopolyhedrovirus]|uniref:Uncharacterized protein n=1 Tax=Plutella xylostella multiple nucleopolyhedrovirus TaxID=379891 RepID=Q0GY85_9ABAC|nr:unknown [Plutella xylostella multiple nucleopolyhedrovirus]